MMRQEQKSSTDQMETVTCMSLEEMEWSISIAEKEEEVQECGDVIFLIVMVHGRASTSTLALLKQVLSFVMLTDSMYWTHNRSAVISRHLLHSGV